MSDLIKLPKQPVVEPKKKRKAAATAPSYHLTSQKSLDFISQADERQKAKEAKDEKYNKIKKEAVKEVKAKERKAKPNKIGARKNQPRL